MQESIKIMKKVVGFIFDLGKGGAQGVFATIVNYLFEQGMLNEIVVGTLCENDNLIRINDGIIVHELKALSAREYVKPLSAFVSSHSFDVAIAFSPEIACDLLWCRSKFKKNYKIIGRCINTLSVEFKNTDSITRKYVTKNILKLFYHRIDCAIAQSIGMKDDLVRYFKFKETNVYVINNALATSFEIELDNNNYPEFEKGNYLLYVGRFEKQKGLFMLLRAFSQMKNKTINLYLIGQGTLKNQINEYASELMICDRIKILDYSPNIIDFYKKANAVVLSSLFEGFPNILVEANACGIPVVSYDMPSGPSEIIKDGINGILVEYKNEKELAIAMDKVLIKDWNVSEIKETAMRYRQAVILDKYKKIIELI